MKRILIIACLLITSAYAMAQVSFGKPQPFNDNWLFMQRDDTNAKNVEYNDQRWRNLDLPHDYSIEGIMSPDLASCTGYLPGGIAWYRKHFTVNDSEALHYIYFEGIYNRSEVYLNGHLLGKRPN